MKKFLSLLLVAATGCFCSAPTDKADYNIVPLPREIVTNDGEGFLLDKDVRIACDTTLESCAQFLAGYIGQSRGLALAVAPARAGERAITLSLVAGYPAEGYAIRVDSAQVRVEASDAAGVFYAVQTLRKSLPVGKGAVVLPAAAIADVPVLAYRGAMLDVARTFYDVAAVERFIDLLALHNLNRFHFHLTDDQGWRVEIKQFPELVAVGAWRQDKNGNTVGGFFTQDEIRHIVDYATQRFITVIPEIDMPGHMLAALSAYPDMGCTGGPYRITGMPGVMPDILCMGSDRVLPFVEGVLEEITELFPGEYIHIGGDEAPRTRWENCPHCQAKIKDLGLKSDERGSAEAKLQSWLVGHAEAFLAARGRRILGWDEVLEGGVSQQATVMSWRGVSGGIEAARKGHDVIMAPNSSLYLDYYQSLDFENEPEAFGALITLRDTYATEVFPKELTPEEQKHIKGMQACVWTSWIPTQEILDYMVLPRMAALSEVAWSYPQERDFTAFLGRMPKLYDLYARLGYKPCPYLFDVDMQAEPDFDSHTVRVGLSSADGAKIHYTLDGRQPGDASPVYDGPVGIGGDARLQAVAVTQAGLRSKPFSAQFSFNKATMKPITALSSPDPRYDIRMLVDGLQGYRVFTFGHWVGYDTQDLDVVIDLQEPVKLSRLEVCTLLDYGSHIMEATHITVGVSDGGGDFQTVAEMHPEPVPYTPSKAILAHRVEFEPQTASRVRVTMGRAKELPREHVMYGHSPFLFVDEIRLF